MEASSKVIKDLHQLRSCVLLLQPSIYRGESLRGRRRISRRFRRHQTRVDLENTGFIKPGKLPRVGAVLVENGVSSAPLPQVSGSPSSPPLQHHQDLNVTPVLGFGLVLMQHFISSHEKIESTNQCKGWDLLLIVSVCS